MTTYAVAKEQAELVKQTSATPTDAPELKMDWDTINFLCGWMILIFIASAGFTMIRGYTFNSMSEKIARHIRYDLLYFLINKDVGFFDENKTGELLSRIGGDT